MSPIHIITISLGVAFALGFFGKLHAKISASIMLIALAAISFISLQWAYALYSGQIEAAQIFTAGFNPPYSINLKMGIYEAFFTSIINIVGLLGGIYLFNTLVKQGKNAIIVFLVFIMGLNVIILTQDLFNLFVFLEVQSIATAGLIVLHKNKNSISSGFKYMLATGVIAGLLLIGIIFSYYFTGSLNIADIINSNALLTKGGAVAVFLVLIGILLELKLFPANGWALDVYQSVKPGFAAILSAGSASAVFFVLYKLIPMLPENLFEAISVLGIITFIGSNLIGIKQTNANRLLGYSSIGQIGLLITILGLSPSLGEKLTFIAFAILISHYLAKAGLFWLSGIVKEENIKNWSNLRKRPLLLILFGTFIFTLIGFPPFPSFFGKWELIMQLSASGQFTWIALILVGSFTEGIYLFRWLGYAIKLENSELTEFKLPTHKIIVVALFGLLTYIIGYFASTFVSGIDFVNYIPLLFIAVIFIIDFLPAYIKNTISIAAMAYYGFLILPSLYENDLLRFIFAAIFIIGGILTLIAGYTYKGKRKGFYPAALTMFAGLSGIILAETLLQFFFAWEIMTLGSYLLIIRGKKSMSHAFSYMLFSVGGAYLILAAFGLSSAEVGFSISALSSISLNANLIFTMFAIGFMTKTASLGLHIWLPGAHAEAESDVSPMVSAILLKAGVFGLLITFIAMGAEKAGGSTLLYVLGWLGALTALVGNLAASFQEDAKRLLAYSSIGQLGYILFAFAMVSHMGWLGGFTYTLNHFAFKAILFLTIGGVVLRVGTHNMFEMGGLIKKMPLSFIAVLIGIITLSGIPPLSGFTGKWLFYNAILLKGWYFQGAIIIFSGIIAFLYCFRLIHAIFLGQLKDEHRNVKEISVWFLIPIYTLIIGIMIFSAKPDLILQPIGTYLSGLFPSGALTWEGTMASTSYGYWDGSWIMIIVGVMFLILLTWLLINNAKAKKVKQFNIVYAAERPFRPETTHMAHNLYAGYNKALGFIIAPYITGFWNWMSEFIHDIAGFVRRIYSGNGQTYVLHIIAYILIVYLIVF
jgi:formate hydrogenlyase subunit 3/multisubunit Na+/H+ antiporter MnhD subunit